CSRTTACPRGSSQADEQPDATKEAILRRESEELVSGTEGRGRRHGDRDLATCKPRVRANAPHEERETMGGATDCLVPRSSHHRDREQIRFAHLPAGGGATHAASVHGCCR